MNATQITHYEVFVQEGPVSARYSERYQTREAAIAAAESTTDGHYWVFAVSDDFRAEVARGKGNA
jgi:hypothetical protein